MLAPHAEVTVAGVAPSEGSAGGPPVLSYKLFGSPRRSGLSALIAEADAIVAQPPWPQLAALLRRAPARLVYDVYDPEPFEVAERLREDGSFKRRIVSTLTADRVLRGLADADHLMCASEKQRDLWLGAMLGERCMTPEDQYRDPTLRSRIDCVPFGLPAEPPVSQGPGARGRFPQIAAEDELILWNGGIWAWLDAPSAIRALALLRERRPRARLVFMGASALPAARRAAREARELAGELGLLDTHVFFNDEWVPYERRADWLLEADCVLSAQSDHLETRFAFRTRLLDAIWAGLPIVCTSGDDLAELIEREGLGATAVPPAPSRSPPGSRRCWPRDAPRSRRAWRRSRPDTHGRRWQRPLLEWVTASEPPPPRQRSGGRPGQRLRDARLPGRPRGPSRRRRRTAAVAVSEAPLVSIVVVAYRQREPLAECLRALGEAQAALEGPSELIVVDNGGLAELVAEHRPDARVLRSEGNIGFAAGAQAGIEAATGRVGGARQRRRERRTRCARRAAGDGAAQPDVGAVAAQIRFRTRPGQINSAGIVVDSLGVASERFAGAPLAAAAEPGEVFGASGCVALYRAAMLAQVGGFDGALLRLPRGRGPRLARARRGLARALRAAGARRPSRLGQHRRGLAAQVLARRPQPDLAAGAQHDRPPARALAARDRALRPRLRDLRGAHRPHARAAAPAGSRGCAAGARCAPNAAAERREVELAPARSGWLGSLRQHRAYRAAG